MNHILLFLLGLNSLFVQHGVPISRKTDLSHYEKNGIVSLEAEHFLKAGGWTEKVYYTGIGISPKASENSNFAEYNIDFKKKGTYNFFVLGNRKKNTNPEDNLFTIKLFKEDSGLIAKASLIFPEINAITWSSISYPNHQQVKIGIDTPGNYIFKIVNSKGEGYYLDKFVFSMENLPMPEGTGPVETLSGTEPDNRNEIVLPPKWAFGVLYGGYTNQEESLSVIDSFIKGDYPVDAYWIDSYFWDSNLGKGPKGYIDFVGDTTAFPNVELMWTEFEKRKIKAGIWIWNLIHEKGNENVYSDFNNKHFFSNTYLNKNGWHNEIRNTNTGEIDFTNKEATLYWKSKLKPFFDKGLDFFKLDNSSAIPFCDAAFSATQELGKETQGRGFILAHVHSTYDYRHKQYPAKWTGDAKICWSQPDYPNLNVYAMGGLKENIGMIADPKRSTYEIPFLTHDAGGYNYFGSTEQSDELYMRWIQFASLNTIMTIFSTANNPTRNHPYKYPEYVKDNFRKYTHLRMKLFPYIYSYAIKTYLTGTKMVQGDGIHEYQYLFGNELLVAPIYEKGQIQKNVFFPEGDWYDFDTDSLYQGNKTSAISAPVSKLPIFVRKGAIIPLRNYARAIELGNNDTLFVHIYPSNKKTGFSLYEDDGLSNDYLKGGFSTINMWVIKKNKNIEFTINPVIGTYKGINNKRRYELIFHNIPEPSMVKIDEKMIRINGKETKYSYSEPHKILTVFLNSKLKKGSSIHIIQ